MSGMLVYKPDLLIDGREAARWVFPKKEDYDMRTPVERGNMMVLWLHRHNVKPAGKARRSWTKQPINVYRLGDVVDALCEFNPWFNKRK